MRVAIVSDTHGKWSRVRTDIAANGSFDYLFFLGDYKADGYQLAAALQLPLVWVKGNGDLMEEGQLEQLVELDGVKILLCHGHTYHVKETLQYLHDRAQEVGAEVVCFGHTHWPLLEQGAITLFNPGSAALPRIPNQAPSWGILEIAANDLTTDKKNKIFTKKDLPN